MDTRFQAVINLQVVVQPRLWGNLVAKAILIDRVEPMDYQVQISRKGTIFCNPIGFLYFNKEGKVQAGFTPRTDRETIAKIVDLLPELNSLEILSKLKS